jgi:predicted permease
LGYLVLRIALQALDAPKWLSAQPDWRVLLFTIGVTLAAAVFFGLAPALQIARQRRHKTAARQLLIGAQVAGSCVLLIVAGLLVRAAHHALYSDPGFGYEHILTVDPQLAHHGYTPAAAKAYLDQMQSRLLATPGVQAISLVNFPPLGHITDREKREIDGRVILVYPNWVAPEFFHAMAIPLLAGRTFYPDEKHAVIVSESLARQQWPGQNPVGRQVGDGLEKDTVIGVVGNARINALNDDDATEEYRAAEPQDTPSMVIVLRATGDPSGLAPQARAIGDSLDAKIIPEIRQLKTLYRDNLAGVEKTAATVSILGMVAALLAGIGIVSLITFTISQRNKEIAIRLALGSPATQALAAILIQFSWPVAIGFTAGFALTLGCSRLLRFALYGVSNLDPISYLGATATLLAIVGVAALLPSRRALRLDIARTLHEE